MGRRWTDQDVFELKLLAQHHPPQKIAQLIDRTVGGVVFKAHTLKVSLRTQNPVIDQFVGDPGPVGFSDWPN